LIRQGNLYIPPEILDRKKPTSPRLSSKLSARKFQDDLGLNDRQIEVLGLLMKGKSNKVIARTLNMAVPTVKNHITIVLKRSK
jgi:DNA-binding NarL/FixJ family response regulator